MQSGREYWPGREGSVGLSAEINAALRGSPGADRSARPSSGKHALATRSLPRQCAECAEFESLQPFWTIHEARCLISLATPPTRGSRGRARASCAIVALCACKLDLLLTGGWRKRVHRKSDTVLIRAVKGSIFRAIL